MPGADPGFFAGGGQRRPCTAGAFGVRADGGSRDLDKHQIKVHSVHRIFRAIFFDFFFLWLVKKFVEKQNWWSRAGGGHDPQNPPPGSAPACACRSRSGVCGDLIYVFPIGGGHVLFLTWRLTLQLVTLTR